MKWGKNKDSDPLPQINLTLLFGEKSNLPFYYRKLPGNVPDVKTVVNLLKEARILGIDKMSLVLAPLRQLRGDSPHRNFAGTVPMKTFFCGDSPLKKSSVDANRSAFPFILGRFRDFARTLPLAARR